MKKTTTTTATLLVTLALTGCLQAPEFKAAPSTMPAIEDKNRRIAEATVHTGPWTADDVIVSGSTPELHADAQQALDSHASYHDGMGGGKYRQHLYAVNVGGEDRWLNITEAKSETAGAVEFVLDSDFSSIGLRPMAKDVTCSLVRFGLDDNEAVSWLKSLTLTASKTSKSFTFTDISQCS